MLFYLYNVHFYCESRDQEDKGGSIMTSQPDKIVIASAFLHTSTTGRPSSPIEVLPSPASGKQSSLFASTRTTGLSVDSQTATITSHYKSLCSSCLTTCRTFGQPRHTPQASTFSFCHRAHTLSRLDTPDLDFPVKTTTQEILSGMAPRQTRDPSLVTPK